MAISVNITADTSEFSRAISKAAHDTQKFDKLNNAAAKTFQELSSVTDKQANTYRSLVNKLQDVESSTSSLSSKQKQLRATGEKLRELYSELIDKETTEANTLKKLIKQIDKQADSYNNLSNTTKTVKNSTDKTAASSEKYLGVLKKIKGSGYLAAVAVTVGVLYEGMKKVAEQSETLSDKFERLAKQAFTIKDTIFTYISNGFSGNLLTTLEQATEQAGKLADALDRLGTIRGFNAPYIVNYDNLVAEYKKIYSERNLTKEEKDKLKKEGELYLKNAKEEVNQAKKTAITSISTLMAESGVNIDETIETAIEDMLNLFVKKGITGWDNLEKIFKERLEKKQGSPNDLAFYNAVIEKETGIQKALKDYSAALQSETTALNKIKEANTVLKNKELSDRYKDINKIHEENSKLKKELETLRAEIKKETDIRKKNELKSKFSVKYEKLVENRDKNLKLYSAYESPLTHLYWKKQTELLNYIAKYGPIENYDLDSPEYTRYTKIFNKAMTDVAKAIYDEGMLFSDFVSFLAIESTTPTSFYKKITGATTYENFLKKNKSGGLAEYLKTFDLTNDLIPYTLNEIENKVNKLYTADRDEWDRDKDKDYIKNKEDIKKKYRDYINRGYEKIIKNREEEISLLELETNAVNTLASAYSNVFDVINRISEGDDKMHAWLQSILTGVEQGAKAFVELSKIQLAASEAVALGKANASAAGLPFPYNLAAMATVTAAVLSTFSTFYTQFKGFANGGIVGGSSLGGDQMIARVNSGEMILNGSQQKKLFNLLNGNGTNTSTSIPEIKVRIAGSDLVGVLDNYGKKLNRVR